LAFNVSRSVPIYCAIDSPQGNAELNGICLRRDLTVASSILFDLDFNKDADARLVLVLMVDLDADVEVLEDDDVEDDKVSEDLYLLEIEDVFEVFDRVD